MTGIPVEDEHIGVITQYNCQAGKIRALLQNLEVGANGVKVGKRGRVPRTDVLAKGLAIQVLLNRREETEGDHHLHCAVIRDKRHPTFA